MKLLIIGGTGFLGRHITEAALERGHELTLFNRGQHESQLYPQVEQIHGDRDGDLALLKGRRWDVVIDTCGYAPRVVRASADALADVVERYIFLSSTSVYADFKTPGMQEDAPVATLEDATIEEVGNGNYGALKALCEQAVAQSMPGRALVIRPGLIVGPRDPTDRFTYWPYRVALGGEMLAPGKPGDAVAFIDVRDLAAWTMHMAEAGKTGVYNATSPAFQYTIGQVLQASKEVTGSSVDFVWIDEQSLLRYDEVEALPVWVPSQFIGFRTVNCNKAVGAGLAYRPLMTTIRDTLTWKGQAAMKAGLTREQETRILNEWKAASSR
jgi:2'-hydroxyisoflavone reductase